MTNETIQGLKRLSEQIGGDDRWDVQIQGGEIDNIKINSFDMSDGGMVLETDLFLIVRDGVGYTVKNFLGGSGMGVTSVFGRVDVVIAQSGDYNTSQVTESGSLYFTNARAIAATLTGYAAGAGTISSSDTILQGIQKLAGNAAKPFAKRIVGLTDAANIAVNCNTTDIGTVTLGGNRTLTNPTGSPVDGQQLQLRVTQDGTGNRTLAFDTIYRFSSGLPQPLLSTGAGALDYLLFQYNATSVKWDFLAPVQGF